MAEFPKERVFLRKYREALYAILSEGLSKWKDLGVLDRIKNGKEFAKALRFIDDLKPKMDKKFHSELLEDTK